MTAGIAGHPDDNPGRGFPPVFSHNPIAAACAGNRYRDLRILAPDYGDDRGADPNPAKEKAHAAIAPIKKDCTIRLMKLLQFK